MTPALRPRPLLHLEGLVLLVTALVIYWSLEGPWGWFALLFLAPDLSMLGYLAGLRVGAMTYNLAHTTIGPLGLAIVAIAGAERWAGLVALVWLAHIGFDRMLGYGLKYETGFKDTHLHRL